MLQFIIAHNHVLVTVCIACILLISFFFTAKQLLMGQGLIITEASRSHSDTSRSVGLLWASDQPNAETSTWKHTTLTRDRHPGPRWDSSPQFQQTRGRRLSLRPRCEWDRLVANDKHVILLSTTDKMQRYTIFFIIVNALHVSGGFSAHHQELKNCIRSIWYVPGLLAATDSLLLSLLYMFRAVSPPIIRNSRTVHAASGMCQACLLLPLTVAANKPGTYQMLRVQFLSCWWWAEKPPETCRALTIIKNIV